MSEEGARESKELVYSKHVPIEAIAAAEASFLYGAEKYAERNWEKGIPWQALIDSLKRHVDDFELRKDLDDGPGGSGLPTISMIMASACMLAASVIRNIGTDNRLTEPGEGAFCGKDCSYWIKEVMNEAEKFRNDRTENK